MALDAVLGLAGTRLRLLHEALSALRTTVVEDKPVGGDVVLVDVFGDAADDLLGLVAEAHDAAATAQRAASAPADMQLVSGSLSISQARFNALAFRFVSDLLPYERIAELMRCGRNRGGEWHTWAVSVRDALDWCRQPLFEANEALFGCWQELTDRALAGAGPRLASRGEHQL